MTQILIMYATSEGQTAKVAGELVNTIRDLGCGATRKDVRMLPSIYDPADFDALIIGASLHFKHYPAAIKEWVELNHAVMTSKPTAFYSLSMTEARETERAHADVERKMADFFKDTDWMPDLFASFAGAMPYSELNPIEQAMGQYVSLRTSGDVDTTADHEYTDWDEVKKFAAKFVALLDQKR